MPMQINPTYVLSIDTPHTFEKFVPIVSCPLPRPLPLCRIQSSNRLFASRWRLHPLPTTISFLLKVNMYHFTVIDNGPEEVNIQNTRNCNRWCILKSSYVQERRKERLCLHQNPMMGFPFSQTSQ